MKTPETGKNRQKRIKTDKTVWQRKKIYKNEWKRKKNRWKRIKTDENV